MMVDYMEYCNNMSAYESMALYSGGSRRQTSEPYQLQRRRCVAALYKGVADVPIFRYQKIRDGRIPGLGDALEHTRRFRAGLDAPGVP